MAHELVDFFPVTAEHRANMLEVLMSRRKMHDEGCHSESAPS